MQSRLLLRAFLPATLVVLVASVVACGGGGGGTGPVVTVPPPIGVTSPSPGATSPSPSPCASTAAPNCATTSATGKLVDDATGAPLAGIAVKVEPWAPCVSPAPTTTYGNDGCPTPLPAPQATTAADGTFTLAGVPNGHYLLIIGSDSPTDVTRPTIHDNITLTGGTQALKAPTLPPIPTVTPPAAETNGNYRLTTIDPTNELPCFIAFNQQRASRSLPPVVVDEWLTENAREFNAYHASGSFVLGQPIPGNAFGYLTTGNVVVGASDCAAQVIPVAFSGIASYSADPRTAWFGGTAYAYQNGNQAAALVEFPLDPRAFTDPHVTQWP